MPKSAAKTAGASTSARAKRERIRSDFMDWETSWFVDCKGNAVHERFHRPFDARAQISTESNERNEARLTEWLRKLHPKAAAKGSPQRYSRAPIWPSSSAMSRSHAAKSRSACGIT